MTDTDLLLDQIALTSIKGMTPAIAVELCDRLGGVSQLMHMPYQRLSAIVGRSCKSLSDSARHKALDEAEREVQFLAGTDKVRPVFITDPDYPHRLAQCPDAPLMLYVSGDTDLNTARVISIVGTRHATNYGVGFIKRLVDDIKSKLDNVVIVSGLAYGIDIAAHTAALKAGIPTVAVLAHGLTTIYPAQHRGVAIDMLRQGGMLVTEYRSDAAVHKGNFLARNRIVAGLSDCVVVVESAKAGGAITTARLANKYSRDVMAVPGRVGDKYSEGCNYLIANNLSSLITSADDLIAQMCWPMKQVEGTQTTLPLTLTDEEQMVITYLTNHNSVTINDLSLALDIAVSKLMSLLIDMEFKNLVISRAGGRYELT